MIETFNSRDEAMDFIEMLASIAEATDSYFRAEIFRTTDNRYRVGVHTQEQMEMDV